MISLGTNHYLSKQKKIPQLILQNSLNGGIKNFFLIEKELTESEVIF